MTLIKSFSVGNGDMFYIKHGSNSFTIIDCYLDDDNKKRIVDEIINESRDKEISRFISTHPDEDHILGLSYLNQQKPILNFYCVKNNAIKEQTTEDFKEYCKLRDSDKAFYLEEGCSRCWMNRNDDEKKYGAAGISIIWPKIGNSEFKKALNAAAEGKSPNNISPIIKYSLKDGVTVLWFGDLEYDFMEKVTDDINLEHADIIFAPHHGRESGKIPEEWLKIISPAIIIIGEAPSDQINYYEKFHTITQNTAKDIMLECEEGKVNIYVSNENYKVDFLKNDYLEDFYGGKYIGTLHI